MANIQFRLRSIDDSVFWFVPKRDPSFPFSSGRVTCDLLNSALNLRCCPSGHASGATMSFSVGKFCCTTCLSLWFLPVARFLFWTSGLFWPGLHFYHLWFVWLVRLYRFYHFSFSCLKVFVAQLCQLSTGWCTSKFDVQGITWKWRPRSQEHLSKMSWSGKPGVSCSSFTFKFVLFQLHNFKLLFCAEITSVEVRESGTTDQPTLYAVQFEDGTVEQLREG